MSSWKSLSLLFLLSEELEAYYWIGFIFADGYFNHKEDRLSLRLQESDREHLERFVSYLGENQDIKVYRNAASIEFRCSILMEHLVNKFGFNPRKTYNPPSLEKLPKDEKLVAFLLGFIDGDGNCYKVQNRFVISISNHDSWSDQLKYIKHSAYKFFNIEPCKPLLEDGRFFDDKGSPMFKISMSTKEFVQGMKDFAIENKLPIMNRKWDHVPTTKEIKVSYKYKTAVFIGRFQPFHRAHLRIVEHALTLAQTVIISIGSARKPSTTKNPWSIAERKNFITLSLLDHYNGDESIMQRIIYSDVGDFLYDDNEWAAEVYVRALERGATQGKDTCIIGAFKDDSSWYLKCFPQWTLEQANLIPYKGEILNATDIREELYNSGHISKYAETLSPRTREAIHEWIKSEKGLYIATAHNDRIVYRERHSFRDEKIPYRPSSQTADAVVYKSGHILLIKRKRNPGKGLWALPGGFVNDNEVIREAALRELSEETNIDVDKRTLRDKIVAMEQFDHPKRSERGRIYTNAYLIDLGVGAFPKVEANDDAEAVKWTHVRDVVNMGEVMFEDHLDIVNKMLPLLKNRR